MDDRTYVPAALEYLDPAVLDYGEWAEVGMALHAEGYGVDTWEEWSRRDPARFHPGECARKWASFGNSPNKVAGGTIVQMARERGWTPPRRPWDGPDGDEAMEWDAPIICDPSWLEPAELPERPWDPVSEAVRYLESVFDAEDVVGYVTTSFKGDDGRWKPSGKGAYDRTAGKLVEDLRRTRSIEDALGTAEPDAGAWIRFNPLTGAGVRNADVAEFRHALVESDELDQERQLALIRELQLPCSAIVDSGGKSIHAIVRVDAADYAEYRRRVDYLYRVCERHGLKVDQQNKNPSRLSRCPGFMRAGNPQRLVSGPCGKASWAEWVEFVEESEDGLPEIEQFRYGDVPEPIPEVVEGLICEGDKVMLASASKAGKSYAAIELAVAIAEGAEWLGRRCEQGKVLYVNLELKPAKRQERMRMVYDAMGLEPAHASDIGYMDLRGKAVALDKLARSIVRRAANRGYRAVIIDPLYKVMEGEENDQAAVKRFCLNLDYLTDRLGAVVFFVHHYSKGDQWGKSAIDRASGSGVFARDADALLNATELELDEAQRRQREDLWVGDACRAYLAANVPNWESLIDADASLAGGDKLVSECRRVLDPLRLSGGLLAAVHAARGKAAEEKAFRIEGTFRELPAQTIDVWFSRPLHTVDATGILGDIKPDGNNWDGKGHDRRKKTPEQRRKERKKALEDAFSTIDTGDGVTVKDLAGFMGASEKTVKNHIAEHGGFWVKNGTVGRK
ncbi:MAG: AAA family ATPase [Eggerthellaceae bacterium]|nr:AAA family ATPase [Eggerthellaceae bacterium]